MPSGMRLDDLDQAPNATTGEFVDAAFAVHDALGPGMSEWVYRDALGIKLAARGLSVEREVRRDAIYRGTRLSKAFRLDLLVAGQVVVELKAVEDLHPVRFAQLRTYLKLTSLPVGLLVNFHAPRLKDGLHRVVVSRRAPSPSASPTLRVEERMAE